MELGKVLQSTRTVESTMQQWGTLGAHAYLLRKRFGLMHHAGLCHLMSKRWGPPVLSSEGLGRSVSTTWRVGLYSHLSAASELSPPSMSTSEQD